MIRPHEKTSDLSFADNELESCEFQIEDLFDLVFGAESESTGYLSMIYQCFLDDSKDKTQSKVFVSAGFFGDRQGWTDLRSAWQACLKRNGISYYKSSEYNRLDGEFAKFRTSAYPPPEGREAAMKIKLDFQGVIKGNPAIRGVGIVVLVEDYRKVLLRPESTGVLGQNPYHRAFESVMLETAKIIRKRAGKNVVSFVHDDESDAPILIRLYCGFKEKNPGISRVIGGFSFMDDKTQPPLQMADMIANNILEVAMDLLAKGQLDKDRFQYTENMSFVGLWNEHYMLSVLKRNLETNGQSIPIDLQSEEYG